MPQTYQDFYNSLKKDSAVASTNPLAKYETAKTILPSDTKPQGIEVLKYNVPVSSVYDTLSDGTLVPKFENWVGAYNNEDRLARQQSGFEQLYNGVTKNARKMGNYVLDATVGTVTGLVSAISDGKLSSFYNNDFSNMLDDWNKQLDYELPNYYTNEQKSQGWFESLGTMNFWANDFTGGLAFVGGAVLPEMALGVLTGGSSFAVSGAKLGFKQGGKAFLKAAGKELAEEAIDPTNYLSKGKGLLGKKTIDTAKFVERAKELKDLEGGLDLLKAANWANTGKRIGSALDTGLFLARTSGFEAGMEARHNLKESVQDYIDNYTAKHGTTPSAAELSKFTEDATKTANMVFVANMAILSVSNAAMFGKAFNINVPKFKPFEKFVDNISGLGTKEVVVDGVKQMTLKTATKAQKFTGNAIRYAKPFVTEGLYEEGLQGVAGATMQNYLKSKYSDDNAHSYSFMSSLTEALGKQYGTDEGWKEMVIGGLIGLIGGPMITPRARDENGVKERFIDKFPGVGNNSRKAAQEALGAKVDAVNKGVDTIRKMNRADSAKAYRNRMESQSETGQVNLIDESMANKAFIESQESLKTVSEIKSTYAEVIMATDMSENFDSPAQEQAYKQTLITQFEKDAKNYKKAKQLVENLGIGNKLNIGEDILGNELEVTDAIQTYAYLGLSAKQKADEIGTELDELIGSNGIASQIEFVSTLNEEQQQKLTELAKHNKNLKNLTTRAEKLAMELQSTTPESPRYKSLSEKAVLAQQAVLDTTNRINDIESALELTNQATSVDALGSPSISSRLAELDRLEDYVKALKTVGQIEQANAVESRLNQAKIFLDTHREANNFFAKLAQEDFFSTKKGIKFKSDVIGKPYKMSSLFVKTVEENNELFDNSLAKFGISDMGNRTTFLRNILENNPQLSEREKYKLETVLRLHLSAQSLNKIVNDAATQAESLSTNQATTGDSLPPLVNLTEEDILNKEILQNALNKIFTEIEYLRGSKTKARKVQKLEAELKALQQELANLNQQINQENAIQEQSTTTVPVQSETETGEKVDEEISRARLQELAGKVKETEDKIQAKKEEINNVVSETIPFVTAPELVELQELSKKRNTTKSNFTQAEEDRYQELKDAVDDWILITGTVVDGYRLSDLIIQKNLLDNIITEKEAADITDFTDKMVLEDLKISESGGGSNVDLTLGYYSVFASQNPDTGLVEVNGMKADAFLDELGFKYAYNKEDNTYKVVINGNAHIIAVDPVRGNLLLSEEAINDINNFSQVQVIPTNKDIPSGFQVVYKFDPDTNKGTRLRSNYDADFVQQMDQEDVYNAQVGQAEIEIDPNDKLNKEILKNFKAALYNKTDEEVEQKRKEEIQIAEANDTVLNNHNIRLAKLQDQKKEAKDKAKKSELNRKIAELNNKIANRKEKLVAKIDKDLAKQRSIGLTKEQKKKLLAEAVSRLVLHVSQNGVRLQVLKGSRTTGKIGQKELSFNSMRASLITEELLVELANTGTAKTITVPGLEVEKVLLGHPNLNVEKTDNGATAIVYETPDPRKIVTVGYLSNGTVKYRDKTIEINEYYLQQAKKNKNNVIPVVVFKKGNKYVAYPAKLNEREKRDHKEFERIYNSSLPIAEKAVALNKYLSENGIDITAPGEAFYVIGTSNLNNSFFDKKLAQLNQKKYFYNMEEWLSETKTNQDEIVTKQIQVSIDLSDPIHSPKLKLKLPSLSNVATEDDETAEVDPTIRDKVNAFLNQQPSPSTTQNAQEDLNTKC